MKFSELIAFFLFRIRLYSMTSLAWEHVKISLFTFRSNNDTNTFLGTKLPTKKKAKMNLNLFIKFSSGCKLCMQILDFYYRRKCNLFPLRSMFFHLVMNNDNNGVLMKIIMEERGKKALENLNRKHCHIHFLNKKQAFSRKTNRTYSYFEYSLIHVALIEWPKCLQSSNK